MPDAPTLTVDELAELERRVGAALDARDPSSLCVLGFGEISVALGWPIDRPRLACKRTPPFTRAEFEAYEGLVTDYIAQLRAAGQAVADTTILSLDRDDRVVAYLVQDLLDADTLGHRVLRAAEPDPEHPFLVALAGALGLVRPTLSLDAQVTNFGWDGSTLTLVDVGTPFRWDDAGRFLFDIRPFTRMLPAPTRALVVREMTGLVERWRDPRRVAVDIVANLHREGLEEWVRPTLVALNRRLETAEPITDTEALAYYEEDARTWPRLKKLQAVERWWRSTVRRQRYEFFIESTFGD